MARGTAKLFNTAKGGFSFMAPDHGGSDNFVHASAVERAGLRGLSEGKRVTFAVAELRRSGKLAAADLQVSASGTASMASSRPIKWKQQEKNDA